MFNTDVTFFSQFIFFATATSVFCRTSGRFMHEKQWDTFDDQLGLCRSRSCESYVFRV